MGIEYNETYLYIYIYVHMCACRSTCAFMFRPPQPSAQQKDIDFGVFCHSGNPNDNVMFNGVLT